jgi:hypothetical protein
VITELSGVCDELSLPLSPERHAARDRRESGMRWTAAPGGQPFVRIRAAIGAAGL